MKTVKLLGLVAVAVLALGLLGLALDGGGSEDSATVGEAGADEYAYSAGEGAVMADIDRALGRAGAPELAALNTRNTAAPAPPVLAQDSIAKSLPAAAAGGSTASAPAPVPAPAAPSAAPSQALDGRKIVQTASIRLQVKEVGAGFEEVGRIATSAGGFVASSNFSFAGDQQVAAATIRVPADRYQDVLEQLRKLGAKVDSEASNASDITEQYSDLSARQRNLEATETQLLNLLSQARNVGEVLQVQDRLNSVRTEIDQVKGRIALYDRLADMATISVTLRPVVGASSGGGGSALSERISEAWQDSLDFLGSILGGVVTAVVFGWWLPLIAVPAGLAARKWLRTRPMAAKAVD